jgi:hypothetical protein
MTDRKPLLYTIFITPRHAWICGPCANSPAYIHMTKTVDVGTVRPRERCNHCDGEFLS